MNEVGFMSLPVAPPCAHALRPTPSGVGCACGHVAVSFAELERLGFHRRTRQERDAARLSEECRRLEGENLALRRANDWLRDLLAEHVGVDAAATEPGAAR